jgi:hypothetical protein
VVYNPKAIEPKWQTYWEENAVFRVAVDLNKPKFYALDMFPYPSGAGLHVGHPEGYTATDILSRYKRMRGFNVLHPMGWDSYGLPAERYAMRTGIHPAVITAENIDTFRGQVRRLGFSYDWARELATTDPDFVRWTQWIFLKRIVRPKVWQQTGRNRSLRGQPWIVRRHATRQRPVSALHGAQPARPAFCRISRPIARRFVPPPLASTRTIPHRVHGSPPRPSRLQRPVARRCNS